MVLALVRERSRHVDALGIVQRDRGIGDPDDDRTLLVQELREVAAHVAEALNGGAHPGERPIPLRCGVANAEQGASRRRLLPPERAADRQRLAGDDAEHRMSLVHRVRVEDPGHHRPVRADVRCWNVLLGADLVDDLARVAPCELFQLPARQSLRVADDAAFRAAERDSHQRALPRHPHGECLDLVQRDVGVVANAALGRPPRDVVRDAIALEDLGRAVVHRHRHGDLDGFLALAEHGDEVRVDVERVGHSAKLAAGDLERVLAKVRDTRFDCCHSPLLSGDTRASI